MKTYDEIEFHPNLRRKSNLHPYITKNDFLLCFTVYAGKNDSMAALKGK